VLGAADDVVRCVPLALEQQVGLADGVRLGVDLLTVEMGRDLLAPFARQLLERLLRHGQHPARTRSAIIEKVRAGFDRVGDGEEDQLRHELHGVALGPVLAGLFVVLLVEAADQLLEDRAHAVVVETGLLHRAIAVQDRFGAQVDVRREQLLDQRVQRIRLRQPRDLVAELELLEDVLHVRREAVQVSLEVRPELLLARPGTQVPERELRRVVERLAGRLPQGLVLMDDAGRVHRGLHVQHRLLGRLQHRIQPAQHGHRQDHVPVLAPDVKVPEDIVGNAPDEVGDPVQLTLFHAASQSLRLKRVSRHQEGRMWAGGNGTGLGRGKLTCQ